MKNPDAEFWRNFSSLLERLKKAGIVLRYSAQPTPEGLLDVDWNPKYEGTLGGEAAFLGLARLLQDVSRAGPLTAGEQAMIQMLRQVLEDGDDGDIFGTAE